MNAGSWVLLALRTLYALAGMGTIAWGIWMWLEADIDGLPIAFVLAGLSMLGAAAWVRSTYRVRGTIATIGIWVGAAPAVGLAGLLLVGSSIAGSWQLTVAGIITLVLSGVIPTTMMNFRLSAFAT